jgi:hypothetical protein
VSARTPLIEGWPWSSARAGAVTATVQAARTKAATAGERASWGQARTRVESGRSLTGRGSADEPAAGQVGQAQPRPGGQRVGGGQGDQDRLGQQRLAVQAAVIEGAQQESHVGETVA